MSTTPSWRDLVRRELERYRRRTDSDIVGRQELLRQANHRFERAYPDAKTPEQTVSRCLQELRNNGELTFLENGRYRIEELDLENSTVTCVSESEREILDRWGDLIAHYSDGRQFDLLDHYDPAEATQRARTFIQDPSREHFEDLWSQLFSAQRSGSPSSIYVKWTEKKEHTDAELASLIEEILTADEFDPAWQRKLGAERTLWELFGLLHIETHPIINGSTEQGLAFFGYPAVNSYQRGREIFEDFKLDYEAIVGHGSAGTSHEAPVNLEIDQLFNVIDKVSEGDLDAESHEEAVELYQLILHHDEDVNSFDSSDETATVESPEQNKLDEGIQYFWVNQKSQGEIEGEFLSASDTMWVRDLTVINSGDIIFHHQNGNIAAYSRALSEAYQIDTEDGKRYRVDLEVTRISEPIPIEEIQKELTKPEVKQGTKYYPFTEAGTLRQGYLGHLSETAGELLLNRIGVDEILKEPVTSTIEPELNRLQTLLDPPAIDISLPNSLYFEDGDEIRRQIEASLNSGKHIIFTGPPGTGKSKLAKHVATEATNDLVEATDPNYANVHDWEFTTATSEWTTFDTIGGYVPDVSDGGSELIFQPRLFLNCFRDDTITNRWLIIDEINRSDIDKAFGSLFSVLTGDSVTLPYEREDTIEIVSVDQQTSQKDLEKIAASPDLFPVTPSWRLIATMNTYDKASLYEMSYAFMRRFNFIHIGIPSLKVDDELRTDLLNPANPDNYAAVWFDADAPETRILADLHRDLIVIWREVNTYRPIGPSIIRDIIGYIYAYDGIETGTRTTEALTSALVALVFPQLEGLRPNQQKKLIRRLGTSSEHVDAQQLQRKAADFFNINLDE